MAIHGDGRFGMRLAFLAAAMLFIAASASAFQVGSGSSLLGGKGITSAVGSSFVCPAFLGSRAGPQAASLFGKRGAQARGKGRSGVTGLRAEADYYASLGIAKGADADSIKKAFRQKARKLHPDVNKSPTAIKDFQEIQQAYEVLSDPQKKQMYDQFGEAGVKGGGFGGGGSGFQDFGDFSPFGDIFDTFFGGGGGGGRSRRPQGPQQGEDLRLDVEIDFEKAIFGGDEKIKITHLETCDTCEVRPRC